MALAEPFYSINYFKTEGLVELTWLPGTQEMTDQDFKEALCVFERRSPTSCETFNHRYASIHGSTFRPGRRVAR